MAKLNKLITFAYLKEEVDIPQSIPDQELEHPIYRAQEMLRMLMCDEFYQSFLAAYLAGTLTGVYATLYPYVKQFLAWQSYEYWTIKANFKPTRSGFRVHSEENSVAASDIQMATLIKDSKQQSQYYKKLLIDFIEGNPTNYPLYCGDCGNNNAGNSFHISAVKKKHHDNCKCNRCRC